MLQTLKHSLVLLLMVSLTSMVGLISIFLPFSTVSAQLKDCDTVPTEEKEEKCEELKDQLKNIEESLKKEKEQLAQQEAKSASISTKISQLENKIRQHEISIQARRLAIQNLSGSIEENRARIEILSERIKKAEQSLAQLIRKTDVKDRYSIVEVVLGSKNFSDFFTDVDQIQSVNQALSKKLEVIKEVRILTKSKKEKLIAQRVEEERLKEVQMLEKKKIAQTEAQKEVLLSHSKTQEQFHKHVIAQRKEEAAQIRAALFQLRDANTSITFGQAYKITKEVEDHTGVRPAFLLAILTQESRIGKNVGRCNVPSTPNRMWDDIMPGPNDNSWRDDQAAYLHIVESLGLEPTDKPLSCPLSIGWGGAMGPAQFIPTTWLSVAPEVRAATGSNPPNPWNPRDAFFASGIYLSQLGAGAGTRTAEMEAAGRYYAGSGWSEPYAINYAESVQRIAGRMEQKIQLLEKY